MQFGRLFDKEWVLVCLALLAILLNIVSWIGPDPIGSVASNILITAFLIFAIYALNRKLIEHDALMRRVEKLEKAVALLGGRRD